MHLMWWYRYRSGEDQMTEKQLNLEEKGKMALVVNLGMCTP